MSLRIPSFRKRAKNTAKEEPPLSEMKKQKNIRPYQRRQL